jgi:Leucine-rich repeat (LRR) protein
MVIQVNDDYKFITLEEINIQKDTIKKMKIVGQNIPDTICNLTNLNNLTILDLRFNTLTEVPETIGNLTNLTHLDISYNRLIKVSKAVCNLKHLLHLSIRNNNLSELPETIGNLTNLNVLDACCNKLIKLPTSIGNINKITYLHLGNNELTELPETIGSLTNLIQLYLPKNNLTKLCETIGNLSSLSELSLSRNKLTELPASLGNLTNLTKLYLSYNKLREMPVSFGNLTNLTRLYLDNNKFTDISVSFDNLMNLTDLELSYNHLTKIHETIGNLTNLTRLYLISNKLTELPLSIINLRRLTDFYYYNNEFDIFPPQIQRFINTIEHKNNNLQVYNDGQNVHNQTIQLSLKQSLEKLTTQKFKINKDIISQEIANDDVLTRETKELVKSYCNKTEIHSLLLLSFQDVLEYVWETIKLFDKEKQKEIKRIMNQEMRDSVGMCFTGRVSRLINCLNGFSDLVTIEISDNEQINNIILITKQRLGSEYTTDKHKELVENEMRERGYSTELITEWLGFIEEGD